MPPTKPYESPFPGATYVPHTYVEERYGLYGNLSRRHHSSRHSATYSRADSSPSAQVGRPEGGPQTVEQLIHQGYFAVPQLDPEATPIHDKKQTAWLGLDDAIFQIRERHEIYQQNLYEIELAKCDAINSLFLFESLHGWPADSRTHYVLGKRLQALYADQRAERVSLWKDIANIRRALPESVQSYLSAHRKLILLDDPGDAP